MSPFPHDTASNFLKLPDDVSDTSLFINIAYVSNKIDGS